MSDAGTSEPVGKTDRDKEPRRSPLLSPPLLAVAVAIIVFAAVGAFVWTRNSSKSGNATTTQASTGVGVRGSTSATVPGVKAEIASQPRLRAIAAAGTRSVYWAGPRAGTRIEYTQKADGTTYVRYLTGSAKAGAPGANYVVIATYSQPNAFTVLKRSARRQHLFLTDLPSGAIAVTRPRRPQNIFLAYPGRPYQIEVYSPRPAETRGIVFGGVIQPVR